MYQITVKKMLYTKENNRTKKKAIKIASYSTLEKNLTNKLIELKKIYKDFNYILDFEKI